MRRKNWMGVYSFVDRYFIDFRRCQSDFAPAAAVVCYDLEGVQRNAVNSIDTDLAMTQSRIRWVYLFDYKGF